MKVKSTALFLTVCILINLLTACTWITDHGEVPGEAVIENDSQIMPQNIVQLGETYEFSTTQADGHFLCTVTGARLVTKQSECPPQEWFDTEYEEMLAAPDGERFPYDEWFTEGGAFERNCRLILVDISVTNVDAQSWLDNGTFVMPCGWFADSNLFYAYDFGKLVNLNSVIMRGGEVDQYMAISALGFSRFGEYTNDPETKGYEPAAIRIPPGETVSFTLVYPFNTVRKPSLQMLCVSLASDPESGIFVDLKLGDD